MELNGILRNDKVLRGAAIGVVLVVAAVLLMTDQGQAQQTAPSIRTYVNRERGLSFNYPSNAKLARQPRPPRLALIMLPESYQEPDGRMANYTIEVASGTVAEYSLYSKELSDGKGVITLSLIGSESEDVPASVKKSLTAVKDSFKFGI